MLLNSLGIYGWPQRDENLLLASLLTGDPLLLIGNHGCAKTHTATKLAQALHRPFLAYDASKAMFEDVLGYPNVEKLKSGVVEYISSPVTIWDKELVLIDELNRALPELQSKWLEIIRSRKIMGFATNVKWVWAAMNPVSYSGTNTLDEALIGRFALFLYPPDVLQMDEEDRIRVALHINGDDAPSLAVWTQGSDGGERPFATVSHEATHSVGDQLNTLLHRAGTHFLRLREHLATLPQFLAKFAALLVRETGGGIALDGRRLGFLHRNLLANRAIELAKAEVMRTDLPEFTASARYVLQSSIPVGLNEQQSNREEIQHKMEICFDLLSSYFDEKAELTRVDQIYELFTTPCPMRKAELLLNADLGDFALSKAWTDLLAENDNITLLAYTALQVEARRPGTVPPELLTSLTHRVQTENLHSRCIPMLEGEDLEHLDAVESLLTQSGDLAKLVAYRHVATLAEGGGITTRRIRQTEEKIRDDIERFERLLDGKGVAA